MSRLLGSFRLGLLLACGVALVHPAPVAAQSLTSAALAGVVRDTRGFPVRDATVTVERGGVAYRILQADGAGRFALPILPPGRYAILAEQVGYQPVRVTGIPVTAGREQAVVIELTQRPPPITGVVEVAFAGGSGTAVLDGTDLDRFDRRRDITDLTRDHSIVDMTLDGRRGFLTAANGMLPSASRLMVDGVEETLLRHPLFPGEPATAPLFTRDGVTQAQLATWALDAELRASPGAILSAQSATGGERFTVSPWATFSGASLGGAAADNPADSSASSIQAGVAMGGPLKGDTASWFARFDYQQLQQPTADPFALGGRELATAIAEAAPDTDARFLAPPVRTWVGFTGAGRLDWRFGDWSRFTARVALGSWEEEAPRVGSTLASGAGTRLEANDLSASLQFTTGGEQWSSETRLGLRSAERDWLAEGSTEVGLVSDGAAWGVPTTLPGMFRERVVEVTQAVGYRSGAHRLKGGLQAGTRSFTHDAFPGAGTQLAFGGLGLLADGVGSRVAVSPNGVADDLSTTEFALFAQDAWRATPGVELTLGVRYEVQRLPDDALTPNVPWLAVSGVPNLFLPETKGVLGPRVGVTWDVGGTGQTVIRAGAGISAGRHDLASFAEVARASGGYDVVRTLGPLDDESLALRTAATGLTLYNAGVRMPEAFGAELALTQALGGGTLLHASAAYRHTDYLLRRDDLNQAPLAAGTAADGRTLRGSLVQQGALVQVRPGSNRRFAEFDRVHALSSTGFSDHYAVTLGVERRMASGLTLDGSYTWSRTEDNLVGLLEPDPADRISPVAGDADRRAWEEGRSDLDIPHRVAVAARYVTPGAMPITLGARWRYRSGVPFTPGFRRGVDANGDGSAANDPVGLGSAPGLDALLRDAGCELGTGALAARNACREDAVQALDLHAAFALRMGGGRRLLLTVDAFNVASTATGITDRAAVLVDPDGVITTDGEGRTVLPLVANDTFGGLLARRGDPRTIRLGLRLEN